MDVQENSVGEGPIYSTYKEDHWQWGDFILERPLAPVKNSGSKIPRIEKEIEYHSGCEAISGDK